MRSEEIFGEISSKSDGETCADGADADAPKKADFFRSRNVLLTFSAIAECDRGKRSELAMFIANRKPGWSVERILVAQEEHEDAANPDKPIHYHVCVEARCGKQAPRWYPKEWDWTPNGSEFTYHPNLTAGKGKNAFNEIVHYVTVPSKKKSASDLDPTPYCKPPELVELIKMGGDTRDNRAKLVLHKTDLNEAKQAAISLMPRDFLMNGSRMLESVELAHRNVATTVDDFPYFGPYGTGFTKMSSRYGYCSSEKILNFCYPPPTDLLNSVDKKSLLIWGPPGCGKSSFARSYLKSKFGSVLTVTGDLDGLKQWKRDGAILFDDVNLLDLCRRFPNRWSKECSRCMVDYDVGFAVPCKYQQPMLVAGTPRIFTANFSTPFHNPSGNVYGRRVDVWYAGPCLITPACQGQCDCHFYKDSSGMSYPGRLMKVDCFEEGCVEVQDHSN